MSIWGWYMRVYTCVGVIAECMGIAELASEARHGSANAFSHCGQGRAMPREMVEQSHLAMQLCPIIHAAMDRVHIQPFGPNDSSQPAMGKGR